MLSVIIHYMIKAIFYLSDSMKTIKFLSYAVFEHLNMHSNCFVFLSIKRMSFLRSFTLITRNNDYFINQQSIMNHLI